MEEDGQAEGNANGHVDDEPDEPREDNFGEHEVGHDERKVESNASR